MIMIRAAAQKNVIYEVTRKQVFFFSDYDKLANRLHQDVFRNRQMIPEAYGTH